MVPFETETTMIPTARILTLALLAATGCRLSSHPVEPARLGLPVTRAELLAALAEPGPVEVETVTAADWEVPLEGLLNLDHPTAKAHGKEDHPEPIHIYLHALRHPERGLFIIDTGVERALRDAPEASAIRGMVASAMNVEKLKVHQDTATWLEARPEPLAGVFLTHLHLDHTAGLPDVPRGTPIYLGPGETQARAFLHLFITGTLERMLEGHGPLQEWPFSDTGDGILDVFGDRSLFAIHVPGHTAGSTAYLARTPRGPVLFVGDACHTTFGWEHGVEPGSFSEDRPKSAESLKRLLELAKVHPTMEVRLGHQPHGHGPGRTSVTRAPHP